MPSHITNISKNFSKIVTFASFVKGIGVHLHLLVVSLRAAWVGPSSSKGKFLRSDTFQISGGNHNCLLLPVVCVS